LIRFNKAYDLLRYLGISEPKDIRLNLLSEVCDAKIKYRVLTGCEAYIIGVNSKATIFISNAIDRNRQRFCIGHELGHWMLDRGTPRFSCKAEDIGGQKIFQQGIEARANRYAADLLMPEFLFKPAASDMEMSFNSVRKLSNLFRTSLMATAIRLVQFGSFPAILAWYSMETGKRINFVRWPDLPTCLWPSDELHHDTYALEVLCGKTLDSGGPRRVQASCWFNTRNAYDHDIYEHTVKGYGDILMTILWWKDESMLNELF
jgi:Zn-dependent peptidase ImmA (M78 family)